MKRKKEKERKKKEKRKTIFFLTARQDMIPAALGDAPLPVVSTSDTLNALVPPIHVHPL
jgi:hypothetical protein